MLRVPYESIRLLQRIEDLFYEVEKGSPKEVYGWTGMCFMRNASTAR